MRTIRLLDERDSHASDRIALLSLIFGAASLCNADMDYTVNLSIGAGGVTGFIETDGPIGILFDHDVVDWNLLLNGGTKHIPFAWTTERK